MADTFPVFYPDCTNDSLEEFYSAWYTYINQVFGDEEVRELIQDYYKDPEYKLEARLHGPGEPFEGTHHHIVSYKNKKNKMIICSAEQGYQNIDKNKNDMLCQSYSLMNYLHRPMEPADPKNDDNDVYNMRRQQKMVEMYREFLADTTFLQKLNTLFKKIKKDEPRRWLSYINASNKYDSNEHEKTKKFLKPVDWDNIVQEIEKVLYIWERYGYWEFIKKGKCPDEEYISVLQTPNAPRSKRSSSAVPSGSVLTSRSAKRSRLPTIRSSGGYKKKRNTFKKTSRKIQRKRKSSRQKRV